MRQSWKSVQNMVVYGTCHLSQPISVTGCLNLFSCGEPAISLHSHHVAHWSSGLPVCFLSQGTRVQIPWGVLMWNWDSPVALSRYIGDPDVIDHFCGLVWGRLCPEPSLGPCADNVIIPLDLTQLFCPSFTLAAGPPFGFTTDGVGCWGGGSPVESLQSHFILTTSHWSSGLLVCFPSQAGLALKNPPKKTHPKQPKKTRLKKTKKTHPQVGFFWVFLKGHSALSINLQFFPLKGL